MFKLKLKQVDAILTADWHLRLDNPLCRTDNYLSAQQAKIGRIMKLQADYECPILFAGDLSEHWNNKPALISFALNNLLGADIVSVPGNHDLPAHNMNRIGESTYWSLVSAGIFGDISEGEEAAVPEHDYIVHGYGPFDKKFWKGEVTTGRVVAMIHRYVYKGRKPFPGHLTRATQLMDKLQSYDLILTGDNHIPFTHRIGDQLLVNPGSLTRHKTDQMNHKPRVYLWEARRNIVQPYYLPIKKNVITRTHRDVLKEKKDRIAKFMKRLRKSLNDTGAEYSFTDNMERKLTQKTLSRGIKLKIREAMDHE